MYDLLLFVLGEKDLNKDNNMGCPNPDTPHMGEGVVEFLFSHPPGPISTTFILYICIFILLYIF